jgi:hypothetical protein
VTPAAVTEYGVQPSDPPPPRMQIAELVAVELAALLVLVEVLEAELELLELEDPVPGRHWE